MVGKLKYLRTQHFSENVEEPEIYTNLLTYTAIQQLSKI